jgi:hypothetical protein
VKNLLTDLKNGGEIGSIEDSENEEVFFVKKKK